MNWLQLDVKYYSDKVLAIKRGPLVNISNKIAVVTALCFLYSAHVRASDFEMFNDITTTQDADKLGIPSWQARICSSDKELQSIEEQEIEYISKGQRLSISKDSLIRMSIHDQFFEIPLGYFRTPYLPEDLEPLETRSGEASVYRTNWDQTQSDLIMWYPDMSWPPFQTSRPIFRKCSVPVAHRLRVWIMNPFLGEKLMDGEKPEYRDVWLAQRSGLFSGIGDWNLYDKVGQPLIQEKNGLIEIWREKTDENLRAQKGYGENDIGVRRYINQAKDSRRILGSCSSTSRILVYDTCRFRVYWPQDGLGIQIDMLRQHLNNWDAVFESVRIKLLEWKLDETRERGAQ